MQFTDSMRVIQKDRSLTQLATTNVNHILSVFNTAACNRYATTMAYNIQYNTTQYNAYNTAYNTQLHWIE